jgi:hypothetical protein
MARKDRSDITIGSFEKKHGLSKGAIRNPDGRKKRKDTKLETIRKKTKK